MNENYQQPAFPTYEHNGDGRLELSSEGMTLLDHMAGNALLAVLANMDVVNFRGNDGTLVAEAYPEAVKRSYIIAAAMLEERKKYIK